MKNVEYIWIFVGSHGNNPSGVFLDLNSAEEWIGRYSLSGLLSYYPLNEGVFDWAKRTGRIKQQFANKASADIIGSFCSHLDHYHYEKGNRIS